jgi:uncharacterized protein YbbC (DUF1343 family)
MVRAIFFFFCLPLFSAVLPGVDIFFEENYLSTLENKRIALLTNHTGVNSKMRPTLELFQETGQLTAIFSPEHGIKGSHRAAESVAHTTQGDIPIYSLHGETRRPKPEMLKNVDVIIYDVQCTGTRAYTYPTTLFYLMEEAAKLGLEVIVLDRPNPINGLTIDGPMLEEKWRSFLGYINVPYCHGMTIGELAQFFNEEYDVGCKLKVIPMKGWKRSMTYRDTGLAWIPPSPNIPEPDTPLFFLSTGALGEISLLNIGVGFTLPFKVVGAPWINAKTFAEKLNSQKLPGVHFHPFHFRPFSGLYKGEECEGVIIQLTNAKTYKPLSVQYLLLGMIKSLYPKEFQERIAQTRNKDLFCKAHGTQAVYDILLQEKYPTWKLMEIHRPQREAFLEKRKHYLIYKE